jgi:tetratricopeptide (TPR) repeat protein
MKRFNIIAGFWLMVFCTVPGVSHGESLDSIFDQANNAFWNGGYDEAISLYHRIEDLGVRSPELSYNLGTAYARTGQLGRAVQHYERALKLSPGHGDTSYNVAVIRKFLARRASEAGRDADLAPGVTPWRAVLDRFSPRQAAIGFLLFDLFLFAVLIVRRFLRRETPRLFLGVFAGMLAVLTVLAFSVALGKWYQEAYEREAVVVVEGQVDVMEGPSSNVKRFDLEEGSRIRILEEKEDWIRLLDSENRDGWVPTEGLGKI